jgi:hypothetical protein
VDPALVQLSNVSSVDEQELVPWEQPGSPRREGGGHLAQHQPLVGGLGEHRADGPSIRRAGAKPEGRHEQRADELASNPASHGAKT